MPVSQQHDGEPAVVGVEPGLFVPPQAAPMSATSMTMIIEKVYLENFMCCFAPYIHFCKVATLQAALWLDDSVNIQAGDDILLFRFW